MPTLTSSCLCAAVPPAGAKCDVLVALAKLVAEPGKEIRAAALGALEVVYMIEGEGEQPGTTSELHSSSHKHSIKQLHVRQFQAAMLVWTLGCTFKPLHAQVVRGVFPSA